MIMTETKQYLQTVSLAMKQMRGKPDGFKYQCLEQFVLCNGHSMPVIQRPDHVAQGEMKECFRNAFILAQEKGYKYCEGYAQSIIVTLHAWCLDKNGNVIDPTWTDGKDYYGVVIPMEQGLRIISERGAWGILDSYDLGFPFLTGKEVIEGGDKLEANQSS